MSAKPPTRSGPVADQSVATTRQQSIAQRARSGAIKGALLGVLLLAVGAFRGALAVILIFSNEHHLPKLHPDDIRVFAVLGLLLITLSLAGAGLGAAQPLTTTRRGTYTGFALAGAFVAIPMMFAFGWAENDPHPLSPQENIVLGTLLGTIMGCAIARAELRSRPSVAPHL
jgi:hypothetical protein